MPESVTLSFSQIANQLTTHFNNIQQHRLCEYSERNDNFIHITPKAKSGSKFISNLYPRSILYDYANGTGALDPSIFFNEQNMNDADILQSIRYNNGSNDNEGNGMSIEKIQTVPKLEMTKFQEDVTYGKNAENAIDEQRTDYWSDFSKVTYNPSCILTHPEYNYDPQTRHGISKNGASNKFLGHQLGVNSFSNVESFAESVDEQIRKMFEDSNSVSQVNVVVELDSAWSGVCYETTRQMIDDQLNGKGGKVALWSLQHDGEYVNGLNGVGKLDRIKKLIDFANLEISGIIPLNIDYSNELFINKDSMWEKTAFLSIPFDFFNDVQNSDITEMMYKLTDGGLRKFVDEVNILWDSEKNFSLGVSDIFVPTVKAISSHVFSKSVVHPACTSEEEKFTKMIAKFSNFESIMKDNGTAKVYLNEYTTRHSFEYIDSTPEYFKTADVKAASLGVTNRFKNNFRDMHSFVSKFCRNDDREELKDTLVNLSEAYTNGFEFSDEEEDD